MIYHETISSARARGTFSRVSGVFQGGLGRPYFRELVVYLRVFWIVHGVFQSVLDSSRSMYVNVFYNNFQ